MGRYKVNQTDGSLSLISGRGKAEYGASTMRTGQATLTMLENQGNYANATVTFETPMPDANYEVILSKPESTYYRVSINVTSKTVNGFNITASSFTEMQSTAWSSIKVDWCAFKLYTDTEYNNILAAMPSDASASNKVITRSTIGVNSSASHRIPSDVTDGQAIAEAIWGMIKTDGSPESGVMPVMYEAHDYGIVVYGYLWEGTFKWCVFTLFTLASGSSIIRAKVNTATDVVTIYTS